MGAFFIQRTVAGSPRADIYGRFREQFNARGFSAPWEATTSHWHVAVYPKLNASAPNVHVVDAENFAFATGTLFYKRKCGTEALAEIFTDFSGGHLDRERLRGAFTLGICRAGRLTLCCDALGVYKTYHDDAWSMASSSFLAMLDNVPRPSINKQGIYEYVFQAATYGGKTLVDEIKLLDRRQSVTLGDAPEFEPLPVAGAVASGAASFEQHLEQNLDILRNWFREIVGCFGDNIDTALSGGYDSRLILALLRDQGATPRLHVYGAADDPDVRIATEIAKGENLKLAHVDKEHAAPTALPSAETIARNCRMLDGYPVDGIIDNGSDVATRAQRAAGGALALNGGGGEIYRNFFYLPDRPFSLDQFIWTFYSQFDPSTGSELFSEADYMNGLAAAVRHTLGRDVDRLSRREVEYLYPAFRCGYWMGRNNSVNSQFGVALTPFIERHVVAGALGIPIRFKNHGRFEAALIRALSPSLARYPSSYGHNFANGVPLTRKLKDQLTLLRPPLLRRYTFRLKTKLGASSRSAPLHGMARDGAIDPTFPLMSRFFRLDRIRDPGQFARICTLEHLFDGRRIQPSRHGANVQRSIVIGS